MLKVSFDPFPELRTQRLLLRRVVPADANAIFKLRSDPGAMKYVPRPLATTIDDAHDHIRLIAKKVEEGTGINWTIQHHDSSAFIGIIGLFRIEPENYRAELGYMLLPEFHGNGIATEAIATVLEYGFKEMLLHSVEAIIDPDNAASARVLEKNGFVKEAHLRENEYFQGRFIDTVIYSKLETDLGVPR